MKRAGQRGMRAYSTDLKERLVRAVADGQPLRAAARRCRVAVTTVKRAVVQQRETGARAQADSGSPTRDPRRAGGDPARGWKRRRMPRYWSTAPGGPSTTGSR